PISDHEMNIFMLVTSAGEQSLEYIGEDMVNFELGTHVRVTGGPFEGAEGYIHRIKGDRRLIVRIEGVVAVATAYIPNSFLQRIEDL
ncbi:MAG: transcriptional regulator, partial [Alistipes sp.]|nr:transcriptional regulator [Alistipes sp.]